MKNPPSSKLALRHVLLIVSLIALVGYAIWEYSVWQWAQDISGPIIRVDLLFAIPGLLLLFSTTAFTWYRARKQS